jgi:outer membrane receptor for ferrienterochelin and colicin
VLLDALRVQAGGTPVPVDAAGGKRAEVRPKDTSGTPTTMLDAIGTQVPGVMVMKPSGEVGRGSRVMIRGPSSISLSNLPLVYLDGIRVQAEQFGIRGRGLLSLDFIDPQSIDRIEVLRGPAAAAQFGGEASAGVIMVYTKRGGGR